ncbi:MAG: hypothetical protein KGH95_01855 [Thaumarchaeota archaeon]|nr:hypothetical protein [Nitrososphaerota archaeon]
MPDKSCRTCGGELIKWSTCSKCKKTTQKICRTCSEKTVEEIHNHHVYLEPYITTKKERLATVQSFSEVPPKKKEKRHVSPIAISIIIAGIIILAISVTNYVVFSDSFAQDQLKHSSPEKTISATSLDTPIQNVPIQGSPKSTPVQDIQTSAKSENPPYTYNNCLGVSDGTQLTVTCPTEQGIPYKAVVKIPTELITHLESDVFNLRELSITEHTDSISIQYAKKMYEAKFIN